MMRAGIFACLAFAAVMANARVLDLPWGSMKRLPSPDGAFVCTEKRALHAHASAHETVRHC
jgi:hypothetical protein